MKELIDMQINCIKTYRGHDIKHVKKLNKGNPLDYYQKLLNYEKFLLENEKVIYDKKLIKKWNIKNKNNND